MYHRGGVHVYVNLDTRRQVVVFQFTKLPSDVWTPILFFKLIEKNEYLCVLLFLHRSARTSEML